ncbi:hypothetical protein J4558_11655 [Leptolyngbya sp. 15MV]|nr:hypothetical protein J4558_11655 [Leptolyngbya sp. 15MV]
MKSIILSGVIGLSLTGSFSAMAGSTQGENARAVILESLEARRGEIRGVSAAQLTYHYSFSLRGVDEVGTTVNVLSGDRYRYWATPTDNPLLDVSWETIYDGQSHHLFTRRANVNGWAGLCLTTPGDVRENPIGIPIAWSLGLDFLSPDSDACGGCRLRVADLADETFWNSRVGPMTAEYQPDGTIIARFPGVEIDGASTVFVVRFAPGPAGFDPVRIERRLAQGDVPVGAIELGGWQTHTGPGGSIRLPDVAVISARPEAEGPWQTIGFVTLQQASLASLAPDAFVRPLGMRVWANDLERFVP